MAGQRRKSRKRSDASFCSTQPESFEFFIDECVAFHRVAAVVRDAGHVAHIPGPETFGTGTHDEEWLPLVGDRGWILITKDKYIRKREIELRALRQAAVKAFVIVATNLNGDDQARVVREAFPAMVRLLRRRSARFLARITPESTVEIIEIEKYIRDTDEKVDEKGN